MNKAVFLDRDGVINVERGDYTWLPEHFVLEQGVELALSLLKSNGWLTIIITNQAGIAKGIYTEGDLEICHQKMHELLPGLIDDVFYSPYYPAVSESLGRKPGSLLYERAIALYDVAASASWMVGDNERDLLPAKKLGMHTIGIGEAEKFASADQTAANLLDAVQRFIIPK